MGTAAVTGSASGIGAAIKRRLEANGDRVIGVDLRGADVEADLSTPEGRERAVAGVLDASGGKLDRLVACAGLGPTVADLGLVAAVNYFGAVATLDGLQGALAGRKGAAAVAVTDTAIVRVRRCRGCARRGEDVWCAGRASARVRGHDPGGHSLL